MVTEFEITREHLIEAVERIVVINVKVAAKDLTLQDNVSCNCLVAVAAEQGLGVKPHTVQVLHGTLYVFNEDKTTERLLHNAWQMVLAFDAKNYEFIDQHLPFIVKLSPST